MTDAEPLPRPNFRPMFIVAVWPNGWMDAAGTWHDGRPQLRQLCVRWEPSSLPQKGQSPSPVFGPFLLWPNGWMHLDSTWYGGRPQPGGLCKIGTHHPSTKSGRSPQFSAHACCGKTLDIEYGKAFFTFLMRAAMLALQALY